MGSPYLVTILSSGQFWFRLEPRKQVPVHPKSEGALPHSFINKPDNTVNEGAAFAAGQDSNSTVYCSSEDGCDHSEFDVVSSYMCWQAFVQTLHPVPSFLVQVASVTQSAICRHERKSQTALRRLLSRVL